MTLFNCERCKKLVYKKCHCQRFEVSVNVWHDIDEWAETFASDSESAAEEYVEEHDAENDFLDDSVKVHVRRDDGRKWQYEISSEAIVQYRAVELTDEGDFA